MGWRRSAARPPASHDSDGGDDIVFASAKGPEHAAGLVGFGWLAENCAVEGDHCVGRDDDRVWVKEAGGLGLHAGEATRDDLRVAAGCCGFVHVHGTDFEREVEAGEEVAAARGGGGEDDRRIRFHGVGYLTPAKTAVRTPRPTRFFREEAFRLLTSVVVAQNDTSGPQSVATDSMW